MNQRYRSTPILQTNLSVAETQPNRTQPNRWIDPAHDHVWDGHDRLQYDAR